MTNEGYELYRRGYCHGGDCAGDQSIRKETAISKAIAVKEAMGVMIGDQTCARDRVGM